MQAEQNKQCELPVQVSQVEFTGHHLSTQAVDTWGSGMPKNEQSHNVLEIPVAEKANWVAPKTFDTGETYQQIGDVSQLTLPDHKQISVVSPTDGSVPYLEIVSPDGQWAKSDLGWQASPKDQGLYTVQCFPNKDTLKTWSDGSGQLVVPTSSGPETIEFDRSGILSFERSGKEHVLRDEANNATE